MHARWHGIDPAAPRSLTQEEYRAYLDNIANGEHGRMIFHCPHCGTAASSRTSRVLSPLAREAYYRCNNLVCGHTFKVILQAVETISPSSMPRPEIATALEKPSNRHTPELKPRAPGPSLDQRQQMADLERQARVQQARMKLGIATDP